MSELHVVASRTCPKHAAVTERVRKDVLESEFGQDPENLYQSLILGAKIVGMQLNPGVLDANKTVSKDLEGIKICPTTACCLVCLYHALLTALVLYQQAMMDGVL